MPHYRRTISPVDLAALIASAQAKRAEGFSTIQSAVSACLAAGIHEEWAAPLLGFLNDSPTVAEEWSRRVHMNAVDRAGSQAAAFAENISKRSSNKEHSR